VVNYLKDFVNWFILKPNLDVKNLSLKIAEREIWRCSVGVNVGTEIDGKNSTNQIEKKLFTRPVLILKKLSQYSIIGIPLTRSSKIGTWYYPIKLKDENSSLLFSKIRMSDSRRFQRKIEKISDSEFEKIKKKLIKFIQK